MARCSAGVLFKKLRHASYGEAPTREDSGPPSDVWNAIPIFQQSFSDLKTSTSQRAQKSRFSFFFFSGAKRLEFAPSFLYIAFHFDMEFLFYLLYEGAGSGREPIPLEQIVGA